MRTRFLYLLLAVALAACGNEPQDPTPTMDVEKLDEYRARILPTDAEVRLMRETIDPQGLREKEIRA